ncbi:unnamed protein product [Nezara viridula]|uniref:C2H2-type domain-containing protein n=1 Tax=Nezara viridula TaxID=85310 RepID=A0A9P0HG21_NEZVI|nr:unnamed protein product [Nezara viridula]
MSTNYTCISCRVAFMDADIQRQHYKTDWHRYNLKRKVINLPPVTAEDFQHRVLQQRQKEENESKSTSTYCKACRKTFSCSKAFDNHLNSKKHKEALSNYINSGNDENIGVEAAPVNSKKEYDKKDKMDCDSEDYSDVEDVDSDEWDDVEDENELEISEDNPILQNNCLFCSHHSSSMTKNLKHMSVEHSFFIPDIEYAIDLRNLLLYLGEKVCKFFMCLWCNTSGKGFYSMDAAQAHMRDKGHCKVLHEGHTLAEFESFYNYSKSYPDYIEGMDIDEEVNIPELDSGDFELTLPSGATIGHRTLFTYYKQHYGNEHGVVAKQNKLSKVLSTYRALGWKETDKEIAVRKAKDIRYMRAVQSKMAMRLGVKTNKLQKHFRPQVNF